MVNDVLELESDKIIARIRAELLKSEKSPKAERFSNS